MKLSEIHLMEASQSETRKKFEKSGWKFVKEDDNGKIVMEKDGKEVFIYSSGKTFFPPMD